MLIRKSVPLKSYSSMKIFYKHLNNFRHRKLTLKVRILPFLTTFTQLTTRLKNFLRGWLLVISLKKGLVEWATVCIKSEVILLNIDEKRKQKQFIHEFYNICKNSDLISHSRRTRAYRCLDEENGINLWYSKSLHSIYMS